MSTIGEHPLGPQILESLARNPIDLHQLPPDRSPQLPLAERPSARQMEVLQKLVSDIFSGISVDRDDAPRCWDRCVSKLSQADVLSPWVDLTEFGGYSVIKASCDKAMFLHRQTGKQPCVPATVIVAFLVAVKSPRLTITKVDNSIFDVFISHRAARWLQVAIHAYGTTKNEPFVISEDPNSTSEVIAEHIDGNWHIIPAQSPDMSPHDAYVNAVLPALRPISLERPTSS
ncbi:hypothetical protein ACJ41O_007434 [Fusarium nematophilum]